MLEFPFLFTKDVAPNRRGNCYIFFHDKNANSGRIELSPIRGRRHYKTGVCPIGREPDHCFEGILRWFDIG